ncbi:MAG: glycosyltransferase [Candidatus Micrarchaeota archaeon]
MFGRAHLVKPEGFEPPNPKDLRALRSQAPFLLEKERCLGFTHQRKSNLNVRAYHAVFWEKYVYIGIVVNNVMTSSENNDISEVLAEMEEEDVKWNIENTVSSLWRNFYKKTENSAGKASKGSDGNLACTYSKVLVMGESSVVYKYEARRNRSIIHSAYQFIREKAKQNFHFTRTHQHYFKRHDNGHEGDYLFLNHKISAKKIFHRETAEQVVFFGGIFALLLLALTYFTQLGVGPLLVLAGILFYFATILFKTYIFYLSLRKGIPNPTQRELAQLPDEELPRYTILVPAYKEEGVIKNLITALSRIEYPRDKLDIKILLEEDDKDTIEAVNECKYRMGEEYSIIILPHSHPKTKPKCLNVGLMEAKGEFLTIYDAEDIPETDQLKKAVWIFKNSDDNLVALQSKLYFYNANENLLSRWFAAEYAVWFEYVLPGLHAMGLPIPLGGTSNHFKTKVLKDIGGWDPYNVTEDADLGMRLSRIGRKIGMMESTTFEKIGGAVHTDGVGIMDSVTLEESNTVLSNWMGQRSRWIKGFIQTFLVHFRHPVQTLRDYSLGGLVTFFFIIIGTPVTHILNFTFWVIAAAWLLTQSQIISALYPGHILTLGWIAFIVGNILFIAMHVLAPLRRGHTEIAFFSIFIPIYWVLMALATFKAIWQMIFKPHYWEKTSHGISKKSKQEALYRYLRARAVRA